LQIRTLFNNPNPLIVLLTYLHTNELGRICNIIHVTNDSILHLSGLQHYIAHGSKSLQSTDASQAFWLLIYHSLNLSQSVLISWLFNWHRSVGLDQQISGKKTSDTASAHLFMSVVRPDRSLTAAGCW